MVSLLLMFSVVLGCIGLLGVGAVAVPESVTASGSPKGTVYYENDFDGLTENMSSEEILDELGWTGSNQYQTFSAQDGKLRIISRYTTANGSKKWADSARVNIVKNPAIKTGTTVIEYDMTYQRNVEDTYGQSDVQGVSPCGGDNTVTLADGTVHKYYWYTNIRSNGTIDDYFRDDNRTAGTGQWVWYNGGNNSLTAANVTTSKITYEHNDGQFDTPTESDCIYGQNIHIKVVLDHNDGIAVWMNGVLMTALYGSKIESWKNMADNILSDTIQLFIKPGMDVLLDNFSVYEYNPGLAISEVMALQNNAKEDEKYEWIEVCNTSSSPLNVYDYCVVRDTKFNGGAAADLGSAGRDFGFLYPGTHTFTDYRGRNDQSYVYQATFENPAYEEGILQPGETAMLLIPTNAIGWGTAGNKATLDSFRKYIQNELKYSGDIKAFVCYNDYNFTLNNGGLILYGTAKVTNVGSDYAESYEPSCALKGQWNNNLSLYESYVCVNFNAANVTYNGTTYPTCKNSVANTSVEFCNYDANDGTVTRMGTRVYSTTDTRPENKLQQSAGFVPEACSKPVLVTCLGLKDEVSTQIARFGYVFNPKDATGDSRYVFEYWTDEEGNRFEGGVKLNAPMTLKAVFTDMLPRLSAYQTTDVTDGTYDIRFVSLMDHINCEKIGYKLEVTYGGKTVEKQIQCNYVYTSILADGQPVSAETLGAKYIFALHLNGVPASGGNVSYRVTPYIVMDGEIRYAETSEFVVDMQNQ